jgi:hypothetical protein
MIRYEYNISGVLTGAEENKRTRRKNFLTSILLTSDPTWNILEGNPHVCGENPPANCLDRGTASSVKFRVLSVSDVMHLRNTRFRKMDE